MATARLDYIAPWWTYWLHNFPHFNFTFQPVDNTFRPGEASYQQVGTYYPLRVKRGHVSLLD